MVVYTEELNQIIRGIIAFRKCPNCDKEGIELQYHDWDGEPCGADGDGASREECEDCEGLGFIQIPSE